MVIDIKTALHFIDNNFLKYTNKDFILPGKNTYKFNNHNWSCNNIHKYSIITNDYVDILDMDKVCIWNHHNLYDENIINSLNRRALHLLECLNKTSDTTLLFYDDSRIRIIYFNSNLDSWATDINSHIEEWDKLQILINKLYNFNIKDRSEY